MACDLTLIRELCVLRRLAVLTPCKSNLFFRAIVSLSKKRHFRARSAVVRKHHDTLLRVERMCTGLDDRCYGTVGTLIERVCGCRSSVITKRRSGLYLHRENVKL